MELSTNIILSGEWSPCNKCAQTAVSLQHTRKTLELDTSISVTL